MLQRINKASSGRQKPARGPASSGNEPARAGREPAKASRAAEAEGRRGPAQQFSLVFEGFQAKMPAEDQQGQQSREKPARGLARAGNEPARASRELAKASRAAEAEGRRGLAEAFSLVLKGFKANPGENNAFQKIICGKI